MVDQQGKPDVTLREYIESRINSIDKSILAAYPTRSELLTLMEKMSNRISSLEISKATLEGKANQSQVFGAQVLSAIGVVIALISLGLAIMR